MFDDIEAKGATRNYDTKPNESLHGPLCDSYQLHTNFKDIASQVSIAYPHHTSRQITMSFSDSQGRSYVLCGNICVAADQ